MQTPPHLRIEATVAQMVVPEDREVITMRKDLISAGIAWLISAAVMLMLTKAVLWLTRG